MNYSQYLGSPSGMQYLTGDILPWHDYVVFRSDEDTSVSVYGLKSEDMTWTDATVRTVTRNNYSNYQVSEQHFDSVTVDIDNPYYAYGNVIGVNYDLPTTETITSNMVSAFVIIFFLFAAFRVVWSLKRGTVG